MRDLIVYAALCEKLLEEAGIDFGRVREYKVNTRATGRWGQCRKEEDGFVIEISSVLLDERNPEKALMETILHELLHTCEGCQNHGAEWKSLAGTLNERYGLNIKGRHSAKEKGIVVETRKKNIAHQFVCNNCGAVIERQRESKFTRNHRLYRCSKCGGTFKKIF